MARTNFPSDKQDQFMVRMPDGMRDELKEAAAKNNRSLNAEIVWRLHQSLGDAVEGPELTLYVPEDLQKRIAIAAAKHSVSPNDEVLNVLHDLYPAPKTPADAAREITLMAEVLSPSSEVPELEQLLRKLQDLAVSIDRGRITGLSNEARDAVAENYETYVLDDLKDHSRPPVGSDDV